MKLLSQSTVALFLACVLHSAAFASPLHEHPGLWLGDMKVPGGPTLKMGAALFTRADGSHWASVSSPDQDAYDIPVKSIQETGDTAKLDLGFAVMRLTWAKDHFQGEWIQGPTPLTFTMQAVATFPKRIRPQTPKGALPYSDQTLAIASTEGVTLGATLSLPKGKLVSSVVILVHGSGPGTRDEDLAGHQPFAVLADYLARDGIAVLRYDKRGIARSTGDYENHTFPQLIDDLNAVVKAMKARKQFTHIGLIGLSEGAHIAAAVATQNPATVKFVVSLAGTGLAGLDMLLLQDSVVARDNGAQPEDVARLMDYVRAYYATILTHTEVPSRLEALKALATQLSPEDKALVEKYKMNEGTLSLQWAEKPFLRALLMSDPQREWRTVQCPVLALNGSLDHQVPAQENLAGIVTALQAGGNRKVESAELPSLNHLFQTAKTGAVDEYGSIEETLAPAMLKRIAQFVSKNR
jgi:pimeloyl-ACP methyl ester carboxylesterase